MSTLQALVAHAATSGRDPLDGRRPGRCLPALAPFVDADVLESTDAHVAATIGRVLGIDDDLVLLAIAFAVRAPRVGHSCLDVDQVATSLVDELPPSADPSPAGGGDRIAALPWPDADAWLAAVQSSRAVLDDDATAPLVVEGRRVFLRRQWEQEVEVARNLLARNAGQPDPTDDDRLAATLGRLFPDAQPNDPQYVAASAAAHRALTVVAGGPGTGKTWTVARILAVLVDQAVARGEELEIALAAPTGKAAARLDEGLRDALADLDVDEPVRQRLQAVPTGRTIHSLLGPRATGGFWHDRGRPLTQDVVVVDETSMASLSLVHALLDAIRPDARVVLVGDPDQLQAVEAGSVLSDVVDGLDGVVTLTRPRRFGADSGIGALAAAIRAGDDDAALDVLATRDDLTWLAPADADQVRDLLVDRGTRLHHAAQAGDVDTARRTLDEAVVLCAHRRGDDGVAGWNQRVDRWLAEAIPGWRPWQAWQPGRVLLATTNDRQLQVFNGDLGVVVTGANGRLQVAFHATSSGRTPIAPSRLEGLEPLHAMTIHKSQGSQWDHVVVVLPEGGSRILTRELLYTAATRAASRLTVVGAPETIRAAVDRPVRRASNLAVRLRA